MIARSLRDILDRQGKLVTKISLVKSKDLICTSLFCEKLMEPCLCRLERALASLELDKITSVDLSFNNLTSLPPSIFLMTELQHINIKGNKFKEVPSILKTLPKLNHVEYEI